MIEDPNFYDAVGLVGSVIIIVAYYLATRGILPADQNRFYLANIVGGTLVMISLLHRPNLGAITIEVMFLLIAILALWRNFRTARRRAVD